MYFDSALLSPQTRDQNDWIPIQSFDRPVEEETLFSQCKTELLKKSYSLIMQGTYSCTFISAMNIL